MTSARLLRVRCTTWDQVEAFYRRKLRKSGRLAMRVPFAAEVGTPVTLALELPSQILVAIDGTIASVGEPGSGRVEVLLFGMTAALMAQLEAMVKHGRAAGGDDGDTADDERRMVAARDADLRRMRQLPAHELLGVPRDPSALELRAAWLAVARREHPDAVARLGSAALTAAAEDAMSLIARAYDHLRAEVVAAGRGTAIGATVRPVATWAVGVDDLAGASGFFAEAVTPPIDSSAIDVTLDTSSAALRVPAIAAGAGGDVLDDVLPEVAGGRPNSAAEELSLPAVVTPVPAPGSVAVRFGTGDLFGDLDPVPVAGAAPIAVDESLARARTGPGDRFLRQIRERLGAGDHGGAQQIAEAALHVYAGDSRLHGLQQVAAAMAACARNDRHGAVAALERALSHDPASAEAAAALETVRRAVTPTVLAIQRLFR
jgi:hypothetical protein